MKKLASILLLIMLLSAGTTKAQSGTDVYEYATVTAGVIAGKPALLVSFSNGDFKEVEIDKNDAKPNLTINQSAQLKYIAQMSKDGWEIINSQVSSSTVGGIGTWAYLLKRKQK